MGDKSDSKFSIFSFRVILFAIVIAVLGITTAKFYWSEPIPIPKLKNTWWGPGDEQKESPAITPFKINVPDLVLEDLKERLERDHRITPALEGVGQNYGIHSTLVQQVLDFWKTKYEWREREKFLNQFPQYRTKVQGLNIHFIHIKPKSTTKKILPLLVIHGWPGSVRELYDLIPMLTTEREDQDFVFEVIAPSLPGYGFSDATSKPGLGVAQTAVIFNNLMQRLGFSKYYIQGGDWGATVVNNMATLFPDEILGLHSNMCTHKSLKSLIKMFLGSFCPRLSKSRLYPLSKTFSFIMSESGYFHLQTTKPDTIGVALSDSPIGLMAYILEKFTTWTNPEWIDRIDGGLLEKYTYTALLDNVMIYWVTGTITSSMRYYAENWSSSQRALNLAAIPINVPSACAKFPHELYYQPDFVLKEKFKNLVHSVDLERGGHFAAFEEPKLLADDIWTAIGQMISLANTKETK